MDISILIKSLRSVSSDSSKNELLKNLISSVLDVSVSDIPSIIKCYSSDSSKVEAVKIIIKSTNAKNIEVKDVKNILKNFSSDSSKVEVVNFLQPIFTKLNVSDISNILTTLSSDSSKISIIKILKSKLTGSRLNKTDVENIFKNISSDSSKIDCIKYLFHCIDRNFNTLTSVLNNISSDSSKHDVIKYFKEFGFFISNLGSDDVFIILETISSNSTKSDIIKTLKSILIDLVININQDVFCEKLSTSINSRSQYTKACQSLLLKDEFVLKHEPSEENVFISDSFGNIDMSMGCWDMSKSKTKPGVFCNKVHQTISNGKSTEIRTYSDGRIETIITSYS